MTEEKKDTVAQRMVAALKHMPDTIKSHLWIRSQHGAKHVSFEYLGKDPNITEQDITKSIQDLFGDVSRTYHHVYEFDAELARRACLVRKAPRKRKNSCAYEREARKFFARAA